MNRVLRLNDGDDVAVALEPLEPGARIDLDGVDVLAREAVPAGHKIALRAIATGEAVQKHGAAIGIASQPIAQGDYVHVHNLESTRLRGDR
ncbi:MAG: altronate hydrolase [Gaiellaceae bacterium]|jgi:altronate dehydratase|nr:altronate hydrolase [Gaiellaceae bacterium]